MVSLEKFMVICIFWNSIGTVWCSDDALDVMFKERTRSDWEKVWHQETHSRCRDKLVRHLYWACEKDIYRLSRRNSMTKRIQDDHRKPNDIHWLQNPETAHNDMFRTRRNRRRADGNSITNECCTRIGCTWEEYAEYCPSNKRFNQK